MGQLRKIFLRHISLKSVRLHCVKNFVNLSSYIPITGTISTLHPTNLCSIAYPHFDDPGSYLGNLWWESNNLKLWVQFLAKHLYVARFYETQIYLFIMQLMMTSTPQKLTEYISPLWYDRHHFNPQDHHTKISCTWCNTVSQSEIM